MPSARPGAAESITRALNAGSKPLVLVRTVTGLKRLAAAELTEAHHRVIGLSKRQIIVEPTAATIITAPPRLADDLFIVGATVVDPGRTKPALASAAAAIPNLLKPPYLTDTGEGFAVTASFHGRRNYNRFDIEDLIGAAVCERTGATYHSRRTGTAPPEKCLDWRVVLDGTTMWVGVRPFEAPLHRRGWRRETVTGSLHPPVAAAMARLARIKPGHRVLDTFCGAGTLLLEAHRIEPEAIYLGMDHEPGAIAAARANTPHHVTAQWRIADAGSLTGLHSKVDRIVTNPPWDVRLSIGDLSPYVRQWRQALRPDGLAAAILNEHQTAAVAENPDWQILEVRAISVAGQHPRIVIAQPAT